MTAMLQKPLRFLKSFYQDKGFNRGLAMMSWERDGTGNVQGMLLENIDGLYSYALILGSLRYESSFGKFKLEAL
jgi:hypothetical protein